MWTNLPNLESISTNSSLLVPTVYLSFGLPPYCYFYCPDSSRSIPYLYFLILLIRLTFTRQEHKKLFYCLVQSIPLLLGTSNDIKRAEIVLAIPPLPPSRDRQ